MVLLCSGVVLYGVAVKDEMGEGKACFQGVWMIEVRKWGLD